MRKHENKIKLGALRFRLTLLIEKNNVQKTANTFNFTESLFEKRVEKNNKDN